MFTKTSVTTVVTTVLIVLITMVWMLSIGRHRTTNIVIGVLLLLGLLLFAAAIIRSTDQSPRKKTLKRR